MRKIRLAMSTNMLLAIAVLAVSPSAFSQTPPNPAPTGGAQLREIPPAPVLQKTLPDIRIDKGTAPAGPAAEQQRFLVQSIHVTGQTVYSEAELLAVTGFSAGGGSTLSIADLRAMAAKIADHYHRNGYIVAQAYLPAQDIKNGAVTIAVLEGRYGSVTLNNQSNLSNSLANGLLEGVNSGDTITIAPLENRLLLLSDLPGLNVKSTLAPGSAVGTSDLHVDVTQGRRVTGTVEADNAGNRYTGENRLGATVTVNEPFGLGDAAGVRVLTSGSGLNYGRLFYEAHVGKATVGGAYSALNYELGKEFKPLQAHGTAEVASLYATYPLIRSRNANLYGLVEYDHRTFQDKVDTAAAPFNVTDKHANVWMASLYGNHLDRFAGGGANTYSLTWSTGDLTIETPWALAADQATARTNGHYDKIAYSASRLQTVTDTVSLYAGIYGQFASKNLDISEKMGLGGLYGVRAYPVGEAYADEGYVVNLEARWRLPKFSERMPGQLHLVGFVDTGGVRINKNPWTNLDNTRTLSGAGVGLTWADYNNFVVNTYYAWKLGNAVATSAPDKNGRFWIQGVKFF
jgi:hemolysin activation/secretion protein